MGLLFLWTQRKQRGISLAKQGKRCEYHNEYVNLLFCEDGNLGCPFGGIGNLSYLTGFV